MKWNYRCTWTSFHSLQIHSVSFSGLLALYPKDWPTSTILMGSLTFWLLIGSSQWDTWEKDLRGINYLDSLLPWWPQPGYSPQPKITANINMLLYTARSFQSPVIAPCFCSFRPRVVTLWQLNILGYCTMLCGFPSSSHHPIYRPYN